LSGTAFYPTKRSLAEFAPLGAKKFYHFSGGVYVGKIPRPSPPGGEPGVLCRRAARNGGLKKAAKALF